MLEVLPEGAYARWRPFASPADFASIRQWVLAGCGVLTGAVTHLVWDAFTHENARGVRMIPWLEDADRRDRQPSHGGNPPHAGRQFAVRAGCRARIGMCTACGPGSPSPPCPHRLLGPRSAARGWQPISSAVIGLSVAGCFGRASANRGALICRHRQPVSPSPRFVAWPLRCCLPVSPLTGVCARWLGAARTEHRTFNGRRARIVWASLGADDHTTYLLSVPRARRRRFCRPGRRGSRLARRLEGRGREPPSPARRRLHLAGSLPLTRALALRELASPLLVPSAAVAEIAGVLGTVAPAATAASPTSARRVHCGRRARCSGRSPPAASPARGSPARGSLPRIGGSLRGG